MIVCPGGSIVVATDGEPGEIERERERKGGRCWGWGCCGLGGYF